MNWEALGAIGEIVGAVGVVVSGLEALSSDEEVVRFSSMMLQAFWAYEEVLHYRNAG